MAHGLQGEGAVKNWFESKWRVYLRSNKGVGNDFIGPFKSETRAWRHRRDFGPKDYGIVTAPDHQFEGSMFPPKSPEQHRWEVI